MAFYGYNSDVDECYPTPYGSTHAYDFGSTPVQDSSRYSSPYEFGEPELNEYKFSAYDRDDAFVNPFVSNHSVYTYFEPKISQYEPIEYHSSYNYCENSVYSSERNYSEPKYLQYEPPAYYRAYFPSETRFTISYSSVEFNEPEFEEYDPTPYGGGYDPVLTYGKPLPPSDITCYPRTLPQPGDTSLENFSYASIPSPYGKDNDLPTKPPNGSKPIDTSKTKTETHVENGGKVTSDGKDVEIVEPSSVIPSADTPSREHQNGFENGVRGDYGYESQVPQIPYGSGLEAIDLCEGIFGYWPCLAKRAQQERNICRVCNQERRIDPWESAADYLFGSPTVYDHETYHHHRQPHYEYGQNSWLQ